MKNFALIAGILLSSILVSESAHAQRFDAETGLMYYKNRYMSTALGRFLSRDLAGYDIPTRQKAVANEFDSYQPNPPTLDSQVNVYDYADSSPIGHFDSFGEQTGNPCGCMYKVAYQDGTGRVKNFCSECEQVQLRGYTGPSSGAVAGLLAGTAAASATVGTLTISPSAPPVPMFKTSMSPNLAGTIIVTGAVATTVIVTECNSYPVPAEICDYTKPCPPPLGKFKLTEANGTKVPAFEFRGGVWNPTCGVIAGCDSYYK